MLNFKHDAQGKKKKLKMPKSGTELVRTCSWDSLNVRRGQFWKNKTKAIVVWIGRRITGPQNPKTRTQV